MPSTRKPAKKKTARKKATTRKSSGRKKPSGPLVDVARKIGSTLGEVAVRTGIVKPGGGESAGE